MFVRNKANLRFKAILPGVHERQFGAQRLAYGVLMICYKSFNFMKEVLHSRKVNFNEVQLNLQDAACNKYSLAKHTLLYIQGYNSLPMLVVCKN